MPGLGDANMEDEPKYRMEYMTYAADMIHPTLNQTNFEYPIPPRRLPRMLRNRTEADNKYTPYEMRDLTVETWIRLARDLGDVENKELRKRFKKYMYMGKGSA
jgi:endopolyphosphatase